MSLSPPTPPPSLTQQVQSQEWHSISPEGAFSSLQPSPSGRLEWEKATWFTAAFSNPKGARSPNIPPFLGLLPRSDSTTCFRKSNQQPACGFQGSKKVTPTAFLSPSSTLSAASDPKGPPQPMDTVSSPLAGSGGALEAMRSLDAVNISVNRVTGGQQAVSSLSSSHTEQINNVV